MCIGPLIKYSGKYTVQYDVKLSLYLLLRHVNSDTTEEYRSRSTGHIFKSFMQHQAHPVCFRTTSAT